MSENRTLTLISSVVSVRDETELLAAMRRVGSAIGFDQVLFGVEMRLPTMEPIQHITSGYPQAYQLLYRDKGFISRDPTVAHCQTKDDPIEWTEQIYSEQSFEVMEESRKYGLGHGMSIPVREGSSVVSMLSLGRDKPFESEARRKYVLDAGKVLANCIHVACGRIIVPQLMARQRPHLTKRELECFRLVASGKSNWDIGMLLNISERAAAFHMKNVLKKFAVSSRTQAVVIGVARWASLPDGIQASLSKRSARCPLSRWTGRYILN